MWRCGLTAREGNLKSIGIRFSNRKNRAFTADLKSAVNDYFKEEGVSRNANLTVYIKTAVMLTLIFGPYALIMAGALPLWAMWLSCLVMGAGVAGFGFGVMHDAMHGSYSSNPRVNRTLGFILDVLGGSSYLWDLRHNKMHHIYTNIYGADVDLEASWVLRFSPHSKYHPIHRFQFIYAYFAYSLATLQWVFVKDYRSMLSKNLGPFRDIQHEPAQVAILIAMKMVYYLMWIVLPLVFLDIAAWQFFVGFLTMHFTAATIMTLTFQLAHVVEDLEHHQSSGDEMMTDGWMLHQLKTTANFACDNAALTWALGGLNFQVEHHLFPRICSVHYPALRPIVKRVAAAHGVEYHEQPSIRAAIGAHHRLLVRLGQPPEPSRLSAK